MSSLTARQSLANWTSNLDGFFNFVETAARQDDWQGERSAIEVREDPFNFGGSVLYRPPMLILRRHKGGSEQRITFEPKYRFSVGAAGRIDVYSYPALREALLLRIADTNGAADLTWDEAEERVSKAGWRAYSQDRLPLDANLGDAQSTLRFLSDLVE